MADIETRQDIEKLLRDFYAVAMVDRSIGHHFDELDLETHLPVITDFWEKVLFAKPVYFNNPLVHQRLHGRSPLTPAHFDRWVEIFVHSVDALFAGPKAEEAKNRARAIANNLGQRLNGGVAIQLAR